MNDEFNEEKIELRSKLSLYIEPCYSGDWLIEAWSQDGELEGRFVVDSAEGVISSIRAALTDTDLPPGFGAN